MSGAPTSKQLAVLSGLAERSFTADRIRLMGEMAKVNALRSAIGELKAERRKRQSQAPADLASGQALSAWQRWSVKREAELAEALAVASAQADAARKVAAKGFGRVRAVDHLATRTRKMEARDALRSEEREAQTPPSQGILRI